MSRFEFEPFWVLVFVVAFFLFLRLLSRRVMGAENQPSLRRGLEPQETDRVQSEAGSEEPTHGTYPRTYLQVPFKDKEAAKACGARRDVRKKLWYSPAWISRQDCHQWPSLDEKVSILANDVRIITTDEQCYRCGKTTPVSAVLVLNGWEERDYEYNDWSYIDAEGFMHYSTYLSSNASKALTASSAKVEYKFSKTAGHKYWMNICVHCSAMQGDHFLFQIGGPFHEAYFVRSRQYTLSEPLGTVQAGSSIVAFG